jgi:plastocyanin
MEEKCPNCGETLITRTIKKKIGSGSIDYPIAQTCPKCKWSKDLTGAGDIVPTPVFQDENETKKPVVKPEVKQEIKTPVSPPSKTGPASPKGISTFIPIILAILVVGAIGWVFFMNPAEQNQADKSPEPTPETGVTQMPAVTTISTPVPEVTVSGNKTSVKLETKRGINPKTVTIKPGDEVVWTNDGTYAVTLVSSDGLFEDKFLNNAKRTNYIFMKSGTFSFYLKHDTNLAGTIVVES